MPKEPKAKTDLKAPPLSKEMADALLCMIISRSQIYGQTLSSLDIIPEGTKVAFDLQINLKGILIRGEGTPVEPKTQLLSRNVLATLLTQLGLDSKQVKRALRKAVKLALNPDVKAIEKLTEANADTLQAIDDIDKELLKKLPKEHRAGSLRVNASTQFLKRQLHVVALPLEPDEQAQPAPASTTP